MNTSNIRKSIESIILLLQLDHDEQITSTLLNLANDEMNNPSEPSNKSQEDKLKDLRNLLDSNHGGKAMNLFPSNNKIVCHSFCLAIATKKFDKPRKGLESGFKGLFMELAAYWFSCLNVNRKTLILTTSWDNQSFEENYKNIIDRFTEVHNKNVFIVELGPTGAFLRYPYF